MAGRGHPRLERPIQARGDGYLAAESMPAELKGPLADPAFFPIAVWLQDPSQAGRYKEAGINLYVALWRGPTESQLKELKAAGMSVICEQNKVALAHKDDPIIVGWMHGDEPDNAQEIVDRATGRRRYGPPIPPRRSSRSTRSCLPSIPRGLSCSTWGRAWPTTSGWDEGRGRASTTIPAM